MSTQRITDLYLQKEDGTKVLLGDIVDRILDDALPDDKSIEDLYTEDNVMILSSMLAQNLIVSEMNAVITGLALINPEAVKPLSVLIYLGARIQEVIAKNNLSIVIE